LAGNGILAGKGIERRGHRDLRDERGREGKQGKEKSGMEGAAVSHGSFLKRIVVTNQRSSDMRSIGNPLKSNRNSFDSSRRIGTRSG
jgi:hypothetical protein